MWISSFDLLFIWYWLRHEKICTKTNPNCLLRFPFLCPFYVFHGFCLLIFAFNLIIIESHWALCLKRKKNLSQNQSKSLCFLSILKQTSIFLNLITDWYAKSRTKRIKNGRNLFSKRRLRRNVWEMKWFFVWNIAHSYRIQRTPFWFVALRWVKVHAIDYLFLKIKTAEKNRIKSILKKKHRRKFYFHFSDEIKLRVIGRNNTAYAYGFL